MLPKLFAVFLLIGAVVPTPRSHVAAEPGMPIPRVSFVKPLKQIQPAPAPAELELIPEPVAAEPVAPAASTTVAGCGDNSYANYIYMHESGCRTDAVNPIGACGIGQALPCSKMPCSLSDYTCQNEFFTEYANSVYGGWLGAYNHWLAYAWW